jgi:uncharacterized protein (DUF2236 family)
VQAAAISRRINGERLMLVAWQRALFLQIAHPLIAAGIAEHSTFGGSTSTAFSRLQQTIGAMLDLTFGTLEQRERVLDGIRAIHRRVHGTLHDAVGTFAAGTPYSAEDSGLLVWVHATLVDSIVLTYERLVEPITPADRDRYCADSADVAVALGVRADAVPRTWDAIRACLDEGYASRHIVVGAPARAIALAILSPVRNPLARRLLTPIISLLAAGQLPAAIRAQYGLAWSRRRARRFARLMTLLRLARRAAPAWIARWKSARSINCFEVHHDYSAAPR